MKFEVYRTSDSSNTHEVEIMTLEELAQLSRDANCQIIFRLSDFHFTERPEAPNQIEIYDDYRE